jgi:hypothetical protein
MPRITSVGSQDYTPQETPINSKLENKLANMDEDHINAKVNKIQNKIKELNNQITDSNIAPSDQKILATKRDGLLKDVQMCKQFINRLHNK